MYIKKIIKTFFLIVFLSLPLIIILQRQALFDWWRLRGYDPPANVAKLASDITLNDSARRLFYVYHPEVEDRDEFNADCRENELTIILGCYVDGRGIYLLDVKDDRLKGIKQVTAAHELLHAAYARLSTGERKRIDAMTDKVAKSITDKRIKSTIALYRKQKPETVPNELHSILGTEVRKLPDDLEAYYGRYFIDRQVIVDFSEQYEKAFTDRKNKLEEYNKQLESLKRQIDVLQNELPAERAVLEAHRDEVNRLARGNDADAYNKAADSFRAEVFRFNAKVDRLNSLVAQYNAIIPKANALLTEEKELLKAIDTRDSEKTSQ